METRLDTIEDVIAFVEHLKETMAMHPTNTKHESAKREGFINGVDFVLNHLKRVRIG